MTVIASKHRLNKLASQKTLTAGELREGLEHSQRLARRVEAAKTVQGYLSDDVLSIIDNFVRIATPLTAFFGDFELTALLSSLQVWLNKKKMQAIEEENNRKAMQNQSFFDNSWSYSY